MKKFITTAAATVFSIAVIQAADWPQWQGTDRTRISKETGLLKQWPASGPAVVWTAGGLGNGYGSMAGHARRQQRRRCAEPRRRQGSVVEGARAIRR
jgi:opacity protein-like surface antigen